MWINILETPVDSEIDAQKYRQLVPSEKNDLFTNAGGK